MIRVVPEIIPKVCLLPFLLLPVLFLKPLDFRPRRLIDDLELLQCLEGVVGHVLFYLEVNLILNANFNTLVNYGERAMVFLNSIVASGRRGFNSLRRSFLRCRA